MEKTEGGGGGASSVAGYGGARGAMAESKLAPRLVVVTLHGVEAEEDSMFMGTLNSARSVLGVTGWLTPASSPKLRLIVSIGGGLYAVSLSVAVIVQDFGLPLGSYP